MTYGLSYSSKPAAAVLLFCFTACNDKGHSAGHGRCRYTGIKLQLTWFDVLLPHHYPTLCALAYGAATPVNLQNSLTDLGVASQCAYKT